MKYLIYGFEADIRRYEMGEILGWLMMIAILNLIAGAFIARHRVCHEYMKLIRQGCFSKWWRRLCIRVLGLCILSSLLAFAAAVAFPLAIWKRPLMEVLGTAPLQAFCLYFLNFYFFSVIQMLLINLGQWEKLSFLTVTVIEVLSLYGGSIWKEAAYWLPGSWKMYMRSSLVMKEGYSIVVTFAIQVIFIAVCFWKGYKLLDGRR